LTERGVKTKRKEIETESEWEGGREGGRGEGRERIYNNGQRNV
jgi:hypothetical protein